MIFKIIVAVILLCISCDMSNIREILNEIKNKRD